MGMRDDAGIERIEETDIRVVMASILPIENAVSVENDRDTVYTLPIDGMEGWSDGFYWERGLPPAECDISERRPPEMHLATLRGNGRYVCACIGPHFVLRTETWELPEGKAMPEPWDQERAEFQMERTVTECFGALLMHGRTGAPLHAVQVKYLNRIRETLSEPVLYAARREGDTAFPLVVYDGGALAALAMPLVLTPEQVSAVVCSKAEEVSDGE